MSNEGQLTFSDNPLYKKYQDALKLIQKREFKKSFELCEEIVEENVQIPEVFPIMKCLKFWINRDSQDEIQGTSLEKAEYFKKEWILFEKFIVKKDMGSLHFLNNFRTAVYFVIINNYIEHYQNEKIKEPEVLILLAEAFMFNEEFNKAKDTLMYAKKFKPKSPKIMAYLGETFYQLEDLQKSLAYFREAFYLNPEEINLNMLKAPYIIKLVHKAQNKGFIGKEVNLWLPIYAEIYNVFYVKRKLDDKEVEDMQKKIYQLEVDYEINPSSRGRTEPLLLNKYIYLISDFQMKYVQDKNIKINNVLRKIKNINESVFNRLRSKYE
jgi:tetratricopeptide (TPR) repeat protein